jgi:anti-anti-sigma factor
MDCRYIERKMVGPVLLVRPIATEYLDRQDIALMTDELATLISGNKPKQIVLTLKQVSKYSSEAIGGLVRVNHMVKKYGGVMKLCMSDELRELFKVAGLEGAVFDIYRTESNAIASFFEHGGDIFD